MSRKTIEYGRQAPVTWKPGRGLDTVRGIHKEMGKIYRACAAGLIPVDDLSKLGMFLKNKASLVADAEIEARISAVENSELASDPPLRLLK